MNERQRIERFNHLLDHLMEGSTAMDEEPTRAEDQELLDLASRLKRADFTYRSRRKAALQQRLAARAGAQLRRKSRWWPAFDPSFFDRSSPLVQNLAWLALILVFVAVFSWSIRNLRPDGDLGSGLETKIPAISPFPQLIPTPEFSGTDEIIDCTDIYPGLPGCQRSEPLAPGRLAYLKDWPAVPLVLDLERGTVTGLGDSQAGLVSWSPSGAFFLTRQNEEAYTVYRYDGHPAGGVLSTNPAFWLTPGAFPGAQDWLGMPETDGSFRAVAFDGSGEERYLLPPGSLEGKVHIFWSPEGLLAWTPDLAELQVRGELAQELNVLNALTGEVTRVQLSGDVHQVYYRLLEWMPGGRYLLALRGFACDSCWDTALPLVMVDALNGKDYELDANMQLSVEAYDWQPGEEGSLMVAAGADDSYPNARRLAQISFSPRRQVDYLTDPELDAFEPSWSPDGRQLAFTGLPDGRTLNDAGQYEPTQPGRSIHLYDLDSGEIHPLTQPGNAMDGWPRWSASGRQLLYARFYLDENVSEVRVLDLQTGQDEPLLIVRAKPDCTYTGCSWDEWFAYTPHSPYWQPGCERYTRLDPESREGAKILYALQSYQWDMLDKSELAPAGGSPDWQRQVHSITLGIDDWIIVQESVGHSGMPLEPGLYALRSKADGYTVTGELWSGLAQSPEALVATLQSEHPDIPSQLFSCLQLADAFFPDQQPSPQPDDLAETPAPTPTSAPNLVDTAQVGRVVENSPAQLLDARLSSGGDRRAELVRHDCWSFNQDPELAYEAIYLVDLNDNSKRLVADQIQYCGGIGASGLGIVYWTTDDRYLYYTDAAQGVPDGDATAWYPTLYRHDLHSGEIANMRWGPLAPDGRTMVYADPWQLTLHLWDLERGEIVRLPPLNINSGQPGAAVYGFTWSPDGRSLVYIEAESVYAPVGKSWILHLDLTDLSHRVVLTAENSVLCCVEWRPPDQIHYLENYEPRQLLLPIDEP
jgi:hypothetical protein